MKKRQAAKRCGDRFALTGMLQAMPFPYREETSMSGHTGAVLVVRFNGELSRIGAAARKLTSVCAQWTAPTV